MKNRIVVIGIAIILVLAVGIYFYETKYLESKEKKEIQEYKKEMYASVLCEYGCPLTLQAYKNETRLMPEVQCVKNCTEKFLEKSKANKFTKEQLNQDKLMVDIQDSLNNCRNGSFDRTKLVINNSNFFPCAKEKIDLVKLKYSYLN